MSPTEYKQKLQELFATLSVRDDEEDKLRRIDAFRKLKGISPHLTKYRT